MDRSAMVDAIVETIVSGRQHPLGMAGVIMMGEQAKGATVLRVGCAEPVAIPAEDWTELSVFSLLGEEVRIVAVISQRPGALRRLVDAILAAGLSPVVVEPVGQIMPAIMRRWKWRRRIVGHGFERCEEWRPRKRSTIPDLIAPLAVNVMKMGAE